MAKGRGRLNSIQLLPLECSSVVIWAADELQRLERPQTEIYAEFVSRLDAVRRETGVEFVTPGPKSFNRHSQRIAAAAQEIAETRAMASAVLNSLDPEDADETAIFVSESIKAAVVATLRTQKGELTPKHLLDLANANRAAALAMSTSAANRQKLEAEMAVKTKEAVKSVQKTKGLTQEAADEILTKILGVQK